MTVWASLVKGEWGKGMMWERWGNKYEGLIQRG